MALGSTQPVTEMSTRNISLGRGGEGGRCIRLTVLPLSCTGCLEIWEPQPPVQACNGIALHFTHTRTASFAFFLFLMVYVTKLLSISDSLNGIVTIELKRI
jgi:hypothetical protein